MRTIIVVAILAAVGFSVGSANAKGKVDAKLLNGRIEFKTDAGKKSGEARVIIEVYSHDGSMAAKNSRPKPTASLPTSPAIPLI